MIPAWFSTAIKSGSLSTIRVLNAIAASGQAATDAGGRPVILARLTWRELQRAANLSSRSSVAAGIRDAVAKGWLDLEEGANHRAPCIYRLTCFLDGTETVPQHTQTISGSGTETVPEPGMKNVPGGQRQTGAGELAGTESVPVMARESARPAGTETVPVPGNPQSSAVAGGLVEKRQFSTGTESVPGGRLRGDMGGTYGGGVYPGPGINGKYIHHHHYAGVVQKLGDHGFGDASSFAAHHDPARIEAAIAYVESLPGLRNKGGLIRRTVEQPGDVPKPYNPYYCGKWGRLARR